MLFELKLICYNFVLLEELFELLKRAFIKF